MKTPRDSRLDQSLRGPDYPEPPENLLDNILDEIPDPGAVRDEPATVVNLESTTGPSTHNDLQLEARVLDGQNRFGVTRTQIALVAASFLAILGAGYLALRLGGATPRSEALAAEVMAAEVMGAATDAAFTQVAQTPAVDPSATAADTPAGVEARSSEAVLGEAVQNAPAPRQLDSEQLMPTSPAEDSRKAELMRGLRRDTSRAPEPSAPSVVAPPPPPDELAELSDLETPAVEGLAGQHEKLETSALGTVQTTSEEQDARQRLEAAEEQLARQQQLIDRGLITPRLLRETRDEMREAQAELVAQGREVDLSEAEASATMPRLRQGPSPARRAANEPRVYSRDGTPVHRNELELDRRDIDDDDIRPERPRRIRNWVDPSLDPVSTFGLDVDTGSYTQVRGYLDNGQLPPRGLVRAEEMLNFFDYGDAAPRRGDFRVTAQAGPTPFTIPGHSTENRVWLRFGITAREVSDAARQPAMLTLLIDTSGSMRQNGRLEMVKRSLSDMIEQLRDDDSIAIVAYSSSARILLNPTSDRARARDALRRLSPGGSTNLEDGMREAYRLAERVFREGAINRVILCSDGVANVGETEAMPILRQVADWAARGIELTTVGVGMGDYNDELLEQLADRGDGRYAYVDSGKEAHRFFVENLTGTLQTVASDARVQVTFDPEVVRWYRQVGYENRALPDTAFRNPSTDAGEIGAGHRITVLYEVELQPDRDRATEIATLALRYRSQRSGRFAEQSARVLTSDIASRFERADPELQLAVVVGSFADALRDSTDMSSLLRQLFPVAQDMGPLYRGRTDIAELIALIGEASDLSLRQER